MKRELLCGWVSQKTMVHWLSMING